MSSVAVTPLREAGTWPYDRHVPWFDGGGVRIRYAETGSGDPVLLLPGFAGRIEELQSVVDGLSPQFHVVAADLPGSGESEPIPREYTPDYYEDDARTFATFVSEVIGRPAHLVGFSDGGEVALLMAIQDPFIAMTVAAWGASGFLPQEMAGMVAGMGEIVDHPMPGTEGFRDYFVGAYGEDNARLTTRSWSAAAAGIIGRGGSLSRDRASAISCPVLLITGEHDELATPDLVRDLAGRIPGAQAVVASGAGHGVSWDQPEWLNRTLLEFLNGVPSTVDPPR
jgi:valacyclovir hydrolase